MNLFPARLPRDQVGYLGIQERQKTLQKSELPQNRFLNYVWAYLRSFHNISPEFSVFLTNIMPHSQSKPQKCLKIVLRAIKLHLESLEDFSRHNLGLAPVQGLQVSIL